MCMQQKLMKNVRMGNFGGLLQQLRVNLYRVYWSLLDPKGNNGKRSLAEVW